MANKTLVYLRDVHESENQINLPQQSCKYCGMTDYNRCAGEVAIRVTTM